MIVKIDKVINSQELINKVNETIEQINKNDNGVTSVNGQIGAVTISIPTNNNQLENGAGYITASYVDDKIGSISKLVEAINGEVI